ncbi:MAG TPA: energy transducer TonB [Chitinophagaceae bacterium]|nr:energy transducer TonB [Chitinophagaceae bacterium]
MSGCETLETEKERIRCTSTKVNEFISDNFKYDGKIKKGTIVLQFAINEEGKAESITPTQTIKKADGQLQEAIRVLKMITFIPRKINGKAVKIIMLLPISF